MQGCFNKIQEGQPLLNTFFFFFSIKNYKIEKMFVSVTYY